MKNKIKRNWRIFICGILTGLLLLGAWSAFLDMKQYQSLYYVGTGEETGIAFDEAYTYQQQQMEAEEGKPYAVLFWTIEGFGSLKSSALETEVQTQAIALCGRSDLLLKDSFRLDYDDRRLCIIGSMDAYELFGGTDVKGISVLYEDRAYRIVGVTEQAEHLFLYQAETEGGASFDRAVVSCGDPQQRSMIRNSFESSFTVGNYMENTFLSWLMQIFVSIVPVAILALWAKRFFSIGKRERRPMFFAAGAALVGAIAILILLIGYPADMIPISWSDFSFWSEMLNSKKESLLMFIKSEKTDLDVAYLMLIVKILCYNMLAIMSFIFTMWLVQKERKPANGQFGTEERMQNL